MSLQSNIAANDPHDASLG